MRQLDVPFVALSAAGQPALAVLHLILARDMQLNIPYRTNAELGALIGVGSKRLVQCLEKLEEYGLVYMESVGRKRMLAVDFVPNTSLLRDILGMSAAENSSHSQEENEDVEGILRVVTARLIQHSAALPPVELPESKTTVSLGYAKNYASGTDLAFYSKTNSTTYYKIKNNNSNEQNEIVSIEHASLPGTSGLASLATSTKKKPSGKKYDHVPDKSYALKFWPKDRLPMDTKYYADVVRTLATWNACFNTTVPLIGETYRLIRQCLAESEVAPNDLVLAVENFARDPWWRDKRPGLATFFDKPARVLEFANKSAGHDRFARNLVASPADYADQVVDGVIPF